MQVTEVSKEFWEDWAIIGAVTNLTLVGSIVNILNHGPRTVTRVWLMI